MHIDLVTKLKGHNGAVYKVFFGEDSDVFYSAGGDGWIVKWSLQNEGEGQLMIKDDDNLLTGIINDEVRFYIGTLQGNLLFANPLSKTARKISHHRKGLFDIKIANNKLLTVGGDGVFSEWDKTTLQPLHSIKINEKGFRKILCDSKNNIVTLAGRDGHLYRIDLSSKKVFDIIKDVHNGPVFALIKDEEKGTYITGGLDATLKIVDIEKSRVIKEIPAHTYTINDISLHPSGQIFATAARDRTVRLWQVSNQKLLKVLDWQKFKGHEHSVNTITWDATGEYLISGSDDRTICIWNVKI